MKAIAKGTALRRTISAVCLTLFLVAGFGAGHALNNSALASDGSCNMSWCKEDADGSECLGNWNATQCTFGGYMEPCDGTENCMPDPSEEQ